MSVSGAVQRRGLIGQNGRGRSLAPCAFEEVIYGLAQAQGAEVDPRGFGG